MSYGKTSCVPLIKKRVFDQCLRRSWISGNKPHACFYPGCNKAYYFMRDLLRHKKMKQHRMVSRVNNVEDEDITGNPCLETSSQDISQLPHTTGTLVAGYHHAALT